MSRIRRPLTAARRHHRTGRRSVRSVPSPPRDRPADRPARSTSPPATTACSSSASAIKLIEGEMDPNLALERLRSAHQTLSSSDHANIARLIDTGTTEDGRPYAVIEYVEGEADRRLRRQTSPVDPGASPAVPAGVQRRVARASASRFPRRPQADEHPHHGERRPEAARFRHRHATGHAGRRHICVRQRARRTAGRRLVERRAPPAPWRSRHDRASGAHEERRSPLRLGRTARGRHSTLSGQHLHARAAGDPFAPRPPPPADAAGRARSSPGRWRQAASQR